MRGAAAVAAAACCLIVAGAGAAPARAPQLRGCIAEGGAGGCEAPALGSLRGLSSLAVSPDGKSVYASAYGTDSVFSFRRSRSGALNFGGCVADAGAGGCADPPIDSLAGAGGIAVSPGGGDVYVAAGLSRSISRFARSPDGALTFGACAANGGAGGCADPPSDTLFGASGVAVGPGGGDVYVTSFDGAAVSHFVREADGALSHAGCLADAGNFGCTATPDIALEGAAAIAVAPRGRDVYVASVASGTLTHLTRRGDGSLRYRSCLADGGANGCRKLPVDSLVGATSLALSEDGRRIFVASQVGSVASFSRSPKSGKVKFVSCVARDGKGGCVQPRRNSLRQPSGIAVAGEDVYVASQGTDSLTRLAADRRGRLSFVSCLAPRRAAKCSGGVPRAALDGAYAVASAGRALYAAAPASGALSTFRLPKG